ncbi:MAG: hypothetical protein HYR51_05500 [Candidatus Rokubacteria bacterium]|nr:hypothetical protein [Candidatus Rokubacteria bacterium]
MSTPRALTASDVKHFPAIVALRTRIGEQSAKLFADLERLHEVIDETRPLVHTAEAFEVLEEMDTQTFEALHALSRLLERSGFLDAAARPAEA